MCRPGGKLEGELYASRLLLPLFAVACRNAVSGPPAIARRRTRFAMASARSRAAQRHEPGLRRQRRRAVGQPGAMVQRQRQRLIRRQRRHVMTQVHYADPKPNDAYSRVATVSAAGVLVHPQEQRRPLGLQASAPRAAGFAGVIRHAEFIPPARKSTNRKAGSANSCRPSRIA